MAAKEPIRIKLSPAQKALIRKKTGKKADALELSAEELEERIAPTKVGTTFPSKPKPYLPV